LIKKIVLLLFYRSFFQLLLAFKSINAYVLSFIVIKKLAVLWVQNSPKTLDEWWGWFSEKL